MNDFWITVISHLMTSSLFFIHAVPFWNMNGASVVEQKTDDIIIVLHPCRSIILKHEWGSRGANQFIREIDQSWSMMMMSAASKQACSIPRHHFNSSMQTKQESCRASRQNVAVVGSFLLSKYQKCSAPSQSVQKRACTTKKVVL